MKKLCFNCLRAGHRQQECRGSTCKNCNLKHHTLLHLQSPRQTRSVNSTVADNNRHNESEKTTNTESPPPEQFTATSLSPQTTGTVFLQTAMIPILVNGETTLCRALLDSGSQSNLITENLVTRLGLPVKKQQVRIFGLGAKDELHHRGTTDFLITPKSSYSSESLCNVKAHQHLALMQGFHFVFQTSSKPQARRSDIQHAFWIRHAHWS